MNNLVLVVTLAVVAIQLTCAAPAPENAKVTLTPPPDAAAVRGAEGKGEDSGITGGLENATPWILRDVTKGSAVAAEKAQ